MPIWNALLDLRDDLILRPYKENPLETNSVIGDNGKTPATIFTHRHRSTYVSVDKPQLLINRKVLSKMVCLYDDLAELTLVTLEFRQELEKEADSHPLH